MIVVPFLIIIPTGYMFYTLLKPSEKDLQKTEFRLRRKSLPNTNVLGQNQND